MLLAALSFSLLDSGWALCALSFSSIFSGPVFGNAFGSFVSVYRIDCLSLMLKVVLRLTADADWYVLPSEDMFPAGLLLTSALNVNFYASAKLCLSSSIVLLFEMSVCCVCFSFSISIYCYSSFCFNSSSLFLMFSCKFSIF